MTEFETALLAGIFSGLLTSIATLLLGTYWKATIRPWVEDLVYKGARIEGTWKCEVSVAGQQKSQHIVIQQQAHKVSGTITYPEDTKGHSHTYIFHGLFFNNVLTALAEEVGKVRVDRGTLVLELQAGLAEIAMTGKGIWLTGKAPVVLEYTWLQEDATSSAPLKNSIR